MSRHEPRLRPHRRLRLAGHAADRAARARGGRLLRDPPVLEGGRSVRAAQAQGGDPVRRPGVGSGAGQPARARGNLQERRSDPRHLLRPADLVRAARRQGRERPRGGIRPGGCRDPRGLRPVRGRVANGRALSGMDEPRRSRDPPARGFPRLCRVGERALRRRGRRKARATTRRCSIPRWFTRPTARSSSPISFSRSPASKATGRWPPSATRRSPAFARRSASRASSAACRAESIRRSRRC